MQNYQLSAILQLLNPDNTISANRYLAHAIGMNETIIYSALIAKYTYYSKNNMGKNGWFFSTVNDLQESTTYGEKAQRRAINNLVKFNLIETCVQGMPAKRYFRITNDTSIIEKLILDGEQIAKSIKNVSSKLDYLSSDVSAEQVQPLENNVKLSSDVSAEQVQPIRSNLLRLNGGTSSDISADKSKDNNLNKINPYINQSINHSEKSENNLTSLETDGQTDFIKTMDYSDILLSLGYNWIEKMIEKPVNDLIFKDFEDSESIRNCSIPYHFKENKRNMTLALKFLCSYSYYTPTMESTSIRLLNTVISTITEIACADTSLLQKRRVGYSEVIDKINDIVHTSSLIDWF